MEGAVASGTAAPRPPPPSALTSASLYVGDLHEAADEDDLVRAFAACGPIASVRVCRDCRTRASLRYAYVNFFSRYNAENALRSLNHTPLRGKPMRIMWSQRDPLSRKSSLANLFVKNLGELVDGARLEEMFGKYGTVLSCKVATEDNGQSKGFGFVQFDTEESAEAAIKALHGSAGHGNKKLYVSKFVKKSDRQQPHVPKCFNVFIKNLDRSITDDILFKKFSEFGKVRNALVMKDEHGLSKGFGFINFVSAEDANKVIETMNGALLGSKAVYLGKALTKSERDKVPRQQFEKFKKTRNDCLQRINNSNVFVKNFDASVDDKDLRELFIPCGNITSAKVMRDAKGVSRGFGFVSFSSPEEAEKAVLTSNGAIFNKRRLYVAIAQRKEDRRRFLSFKYAKMGPTVSLRPHSQSSQIYPYQIPTKQQYYSRNHTWQLATSPMCPYQESQIMYGNASWLSGFPYSIHPIQHAQFVSQWYQPVQAMKNIMWMQGVDKFHCSRGQPVERKAAKGSVDASITLEGKLIPLAEKSESKGSAKDKPLVVSFCI